MQFTQARWFSYLIALVVGAACWAQAPGQWATAEPNAAALRRDALEVFGKLPKAMPGAENDTPEMVELGRRLYNDTALSINRKQSCNTCHRLDGNRAGVDNTPTSEGAEGKFGERNSPTVLNAGFQFVQFWDGREPDLQHQALGPPLNPIEMGMPSRDVIEMRLSRGDYPELFRREFKVVDGSNPVTYERFGEAVAAFERSLISRGRFDDFLDGQDDALTTTELRGLADFMEKGCTTCHAGPVLGGELYQKMGLVEDYPGIKDLGRFDATKNEEDKHFFKVPQLRNIALTAPYLHNGSLKTIGQTIDVMARYQLGEPLAWTERESLLAFMTTLSDKGLTSPAPAAADAPNWAVADSYAQIAAARALPDDQAERVLYGYQLLTNTPDLVGPTAPAGAPRYSNSTQACRSCHLGVGTRAYALPWIGVNKRYPVYRARMGREGQVADRVNECFTRSLNGEPLPQDGKEMQAILAWFDWLSRPELDLPAKMTGTGSGPFKAPERAADPAAGADVYLVYCQTCHGSDGAGYAGVDAASGKGDTVVPGMRDVLATQGPGTPPVWGLGSYNNGVGMARILTLAPFIRNNMPYGANWQRPTLTVDQAYDVAAYINSQKRVVFPNLAADYPKKSEKPIDTPYGPYADQFPQKQHKYGPFGPLQAARAKAK